MASLSSIINGGGSTVSSGGGLSSYLKKARSLPHTPTISEQKAELRSRGEAVSTRYDRATPTVGGNILRDVLRVPATLLGRAPQLGKALAGATPEQQTLKSGYLGDIKTSQSGKDVLKDVGRGAELISYGIGGGAVKDAAGNVVKQTFKQAAPRLFLEGAGAGALGAGGHAVSEGKKAGQVLKEAATGGLIGAGLNTLIGGIASRLTKEARLRNKGSSFITKELTPEQAALEAEVRAGKFNKPKAGKNLTEEQRLRIENQKPVNYEPYTPDNELPTIDFGKTPKSELPTIQLGNSTPNTRTPDGLSYEPVTPSIPTEAPGNHLSATPNSQEKILGSDIGNTESPQFKEKAKEVTPDEVDSAKKNHEENYGDNTIEKWTPKKWKDQIAFAKILPEEIQKGIATGQLEPPEAVDRTFIWGEVKKRAEAAGDGETLLAIRNSPASPSAQGSHLQFSKNAKSPIDIIDNIKNIVNERMGSTGDKVLKKAIKEGRDILDKAKASAKEVEDFLKDLTCD